MAQISFDYVNGQLIGRNGLGTFEAKQKGFSVECEGADIDVDFEKSLKFNGCAANVDVEIDEKVVHIHSPEKVKVKGRLVT